MKKYLFLLILFPVLLGNMESFTEELGDNSYYSVVIGSTTWLGIHYDLGFIADKEEQKIHFVVDGYWGSQWDISFTPRQWQTLLKGGEVGRIRATKKGGATRDDNCLITVQLRKEGINGYRLKFVRTYFLVPGYGYARDALIQDTEVDSGTANEMPAFYIKEEEWEVRMEDFLRRSARWIKF